VSCDFIALANTGVQGLHPYQPGKPIEELQRELGLDHIVKLASNENPLGPSKNALAACEAAFPELCLYPDGSGFELKEALSAKLNVQTDQITLGNGSNDVLDLIGRSFLRPGTNAIYSQHAFIVYAIATKSNGAEARVTPAKEWGHDLDAMLAAIDENTRVIFIANPNNPTGTQLGEAELTAFLDQVRDDIVVVLDEAYIEYVADGSFPDGINLQKRYNNLVVTRTFSKAYGLAALRVGYSISNPQIADLLNRVRAPFNVNSFGLVAAQAVLADEEYLNQSRRINSEGMRQLEEGVSQLGLSYIPSAGNFLAVGFEGDTAQIYQNMLKQGVIIRPVGVYEMPQHLRITIGLPEENEACLRALQAVI
jgi:histidinol-phosphate aminotransferase